MAKDKDIKLYIVFEFGTDIIKGIYTQKENADTCFNALKEDSDINYGIQEHIIQDTLI